MSNIVLPDIVYTHAGQFHADDAFSAALLKKIAESQGKNITIERVSALPENFNGFAFDIGRGEFDHHQADNEIRPNGVPYASFGKLWREFASELGFNQKSIEHFDKVFCQPQDLSDNTSAFNALSAVIRNMNSKEGLTLDEKFDRAVNFCSEILDDALQIEKNRVFAQELADQYYENAVNKEILIFDKSVPPAVTDCLAETDAKIVIFKHSREGYMINTVRKEEGSKESKILLPKEWVGTKEEIEQVNGIPMVFVHNGRFCGAAQTLEGAVKCAVLTINGEAKYDEKYDKQVQSILENKPLEIENSIENKEIDNNIIIDFEFNGLSRYGFTPEIIQMKAYNCANGKSVVMNFESEKPITIDASLAMGKITKLENTNGLFNKEKFVEALNSIGADLESVFVGFSVSTDRKVLSNYDIHIGYAVDLQDNIRLSKYESDLALHGCSMEVCYKIVLGEFPEISHADGSELKALKDLYEADKELFHSKILTVCPFSENAGMPLEIYCDVENRRAKGYMYNNDNLIADSLETWLDIIERYEYEDDLFYNAYCNDEFYNTGYFTVDEAGILEFADDKSFYKCMQSDFFKFALTEIFEINNLDEFDFEQEYEYDEYEQEYEEEYEYDDDYEQEEELPEPDENGFIIYENEVLLKYVGNDENVVVPDGVTKIIDSVFYDCEFINSVTIPDSVTSIDNYVFKGCASLTSVTIGDGVTSIGDGAFKDCPSLTNVTIPKNVELIGAETFVYCKSLESVTFEGNPKLGANIFFCCCPKEIIVRNEEMMHHLYETGNVPEGCEVKVIEKELDKTEQLQEDNEKNVFNNYEVTLEAGIEEIQEAHNEIMKGAGMVYDEVDNELVATK